MISLMFPMPPNLANARMHWRAKHRERKKYLQLLDTLEMAGRLPKPPAQPPEKARIRVTLYGWSIQDMDNAVARVKWILDWMVAAGWMLDDSPDVLEWYEMPEQFIDRKRQRIEVVWEAVSRSTAPR